MLFRASFLCCALLFCIAIRNCQCEEESVVSIQLRGFNYEISKRTEDVVNIFLDNALPPVTQLVVLFESGILSMQNIPAIRRALYLQIRATSNAYAILVAMENSDLIGYVQGISLVDNTNSTTSCLPAGTTTSIRCTQLYEINSRGDPVASVYNIPLDVVGNPRYTSTVSSAAGSVWTRVEPSDTFLPGVMYNTVLKNTTGQKIGIATAVLLFSALDEFLYDNFADQDNRVVFVTTENLDLVGASVPGISNEVIILDGQLAYLSVKAYNCSNERIRMAGNFMQSLSSINGTEGVMFVHSDQFIQINQVSRLNLKWYVVVVRPVDARNDYITSSSTTFLGACVVCGVTFVLCCFVLSWVWKHRHMKLWSYAQPRILLALIACHILCVVFGVLVVVGPTQAWCRARVFVGAVAVTCANTAILGKVLYLYVLDSPIEALAGRKSASILTKSVILLWGIAVVQTIVVGLQAFGEIGGAVEANSYYSQDSGELVLRKECVNHGSDSGMAQFQTVLIGLVCVLSCYFAFLTRTASVSYAESRGLLVVALQAAGLSVGFVCVEFFGTVRQGVMVSLLELMAVVWFVAISQAIMFVPRMFRQLTAGDLTLAELREMIQRHSTNTKQRQASNGLL